MNVHTNEPLPPLPGQEMQIPVPIIDLVHMESASGVSAEGTVLDTAELSSALTTDFDVLNGEESPGQLYAYRYSDTYVVLGTRSAITEDGAIQTAVGISEVADGTYHCRAENANATNEASVTIEAMRGWYRTHDILS